MFAGKRAERDAIIADMKATRAPYEQLWRDVDLSVCPGMLRLNLSDQNKGIRDDALILNSTPDKCFQTFKNGMISTNTNPSQPWLEIAAEDPGMNAYGPYAVFFDYVANLMLAVTEDAGVYEDFKDIFGCSGKFGSSILTMEENLDRVVHTQPLAMGSWWVGLDQFGDPNALYREMRLTVRQTVERFLDRRKPDWSKVTRKVKDAYQAGRYQEAVDVGHLVMPNDGYNPRYTEAKEKAFYSCYFELGEQAQNEKDKLLRESGYDEFPGLYFPWDRFGDDVYGIDSPGIMSLPDNKELNHWSEKIDNALDKMVDPALMGPPSLKSVGAAAWRPGGYIAMNDSDLQRGGLRPIHDINPEVLRVLDREDKIERRIKDAWYTEVFKYLDAVDKSARTATEIIARQQHNMRELVGTMNRLNRGVLSPYSERLFNNLVRQGRIGGEYGIPIPDGLEGANLKIRYISQMAQAMRSVNISGMDQMMDTAIKIANEGQNPQVWNKVNIYSFMEEKARAMDIPARIMRGEEEVVALEEAQAKAQAQQQQMEQMQALTKGVKDLAASPTDGKNALTDVANAIGKQVA